MHQDPANALCRAVLFLFSEVLRMETQTVALIGLFCTVLGAVIGVLTYNRNRDKDVKTDATESAVIRTKLDAINSGVESIRIDIKAQEMRVTELSERVIRVEESSKQAHKRLDEMGVKLYEN